MQEPIAPAPRRRRGGLWPWLVLALTAVPAVWHVVDFPDDIDEEFPAVVRPTMSRRPPPAYRLAEPGDTIDRVAIYMSAVAVMVSLAGLRLSRADRALWPSALGISLAAFWHGSTPGPAFDGWHGLGWRVILDAKAPTGLRAALAAAAIALAALVLIPVIANRRRWPALRQRARALGIFGLLSASAVLIALRQVEIPGVEPVGYWPRWFQVFGLIAFDLALLCAVGPLVPRFRLARLGYGLAGALGWFGLVAGGIWLTWFHRPLDRLRIVEPGKIYMSAMPTERGLEVAYARHRFKTIINLFPEDTPFRSERLPEEIRFAASHGIHYVGSPSAEDEDSAFLKRTLALAKDPDAWPILVHCHGCMDRTPAWMGIYRFLFQGRSLRDILTEIERHRGYRPKASVTLLYNRVLPLLAPDRYDEDPTAALLRKCAGATKDRRRATGSPNPDAVHRVSGGSRPRASVPNLTPSGRSLQYRKTHRDRHLHDSATPS